MIKPGISRASVMGVVGFMVGALLVIVLRWLQGLDPIWDVGAGLVLAVFFCAGFFVWGIGGFDPRLSEHGGEDHGEHAIEAHAEPEPEPEPEPSAVLGAMIWQVAGLLLLFIVLLAVFGKLGPALRITEQSGASVLDVGILPMEIGGQDVPVSTLTIFAGFVLLVLVSLAIAAAVISFVFWWLSRGVVESRAGVNNRTDYWAARPGWRWFLLTLVIVAALFAGIFLFLFYIGIGWVLPGMLGPLPFLLPYEPIINVLLSLVSTVVIILLLMRPSVLVTIISRFARWLARVLRTRVYTRPASSDVTAVPPAQNVQKSMQRGIQRRDAQQAE